jgi:hypothetical protein
MRELTTLYVHLIVLALSFFSLFSFSFLAHVWETRSDLRCRLRITALHELGLSAQLFFF